MSLFSFYSILSLKGRGNYQLSIINYQLLKYLCFFTPTYLVGTISYHSQKYRPGKCVDSKCHDLV